MAERHIKEDFISCDWCGKEEQGLRCSQYTDIERIVIGNIRQKINRDWSIHGILQLTGLEADLCKSCEISLYEHILTFIKAQEVKNKTVSVD